MPSSMRTLSLIEQLVLDAASDDFEALEQIYRSICLEFSADNYKPSDPESFYLRSAANAPLLAEIADAIKKLATEGLLEAKTETGVTPDFQGDSAFVWQAWFRTTKDGLVMLQDINNKS